ncbi:MAG: 5-formyltetrahydrofolate cyclo-ligase [Phycisphaerae bacterium]|jgi:5-formyltetrahydrofolate cyclo-ligase
MDKQQLRQQIRSQLCRMTGQQRVDKSQMACKNLVETPEFRNANTIMTFLSLPHEIDTASFILYAWQHSKVVAVPKISWQQRHMIAVIINSLETGIATEAGGLRNPVTGIPVPLEDIDLIVTPGLAFDSKGNRLGRGGSYYDRFFVHPRLQAVKCGLAFSEQLLENVPTVEHDQPIDMLVTDEGVTYFNKK